MCDRISVEYRIQWRYNVLPLNIESTRIKASGKFCRIFTRDFLPHLPPTRAGSICNSNADCRTMRSGNPVRRSLPKKRQQSSRHVLSYPIIRCSRAEMIEMESLWNRKNYRSPAWNKGTTQLFRHSSSCCWCYQCCHSDGALAADAEHDSWQFWSSRLNDFNKSSSLI